MSTFSDIQPDILEKIKSEYIFYIQTVKTSDFKTLFDSLKEILTDTSVIVSEQGMRILRDNPSKTAMVNVRLDAKNFETFVCSKKIEIGISLSHFFKYLKSITTDDVLTLYVKRNVDGNDDNENTLGIRLENNKKQKLTNDDFNLMDPNLDESLRFHAEEQEQPTTLFKYDFVLTMPSVEFQKTCRDIYHVTNDKVTIVCTNDNLTFGCTPDSGPRTVTHIIMNKEDVNKDEEKDKVMYQKCNSSDIVFSGTYKLKFLMLFTKCTAIGSIIELCMKNDQPLAIRIQVGDLGELIILLIDDISDTL